MASRAIHIEVAHSMEADLFIHALRRFICRRGAIRELRSDRGTNFIAAENELKKAVEEMDEDKIKTELLKDGVDWIITPAKAKRNFGGVWERQIRSVRNFTNALMKQHGQRLDDESLRTFISEAEAIVNGRPLTVISSGLVGRRNIYRTSKRDRSGRVYGETSEQETWFF